MNYNKLLIQIDTKINKCKNADLPKEKKIKC